jgi:hypothetical protein
MVHRSRPATMATLAASDRMQLAKLLGMLGSDHIGERDNAARAAHRLVQQRGITWFNVVTHPPQDTDHDADPISSDWRRTAATCSRYPHLLNRWEAGLKAKAAGKYKGRPVSIDATQIRQLRATLGPAAIAKKLGIARSSVYRVLGA